MIALCWYAGVPPAMSWYAGVPPAIIIYKISTICLLLLKVAKQYSVRSGDGMWL